MANNHQHNRRENQMDDWDEQNIERAQHSKREDYRRLLAACKAVSEAFADLPNSCHEKDCAKCKAVVQAREAAFLATI